MVSTGRQPARHRWSIRRLRLSHGGLFRRGIRFITVLSRRLESLASTSYVNPQQKLVVVVLSARPEPDSKFSPVNDLSFFAAVAKSLQ